jgi:hypothetical protein
MVRISTNESPVPEPASTKMLALSLLAGSLRRRNLRE